MSTKKEMPRTPPAPQSGVFGVSLIIGSGRRPDVPVRDVILLQPHGDGVLAGVRHHDHVAEVAVLH